MEGIVLSKNDGIATVCLARGRVNALTRDIVVRLSDVFRELEADESVAAVILTGRGKFFSFGFDIPGFLSYSRDAFLEYLETFAGLYGHIFQFRKPVIAALNGHTVAGGCMMAIACDRRIMVEGKAKISLNEIGFGSSVFAGSVAILTHCVGPKNAQEILLSAKMYSAQEARQMGLVDETVPEERLEAEAMRVAREYAGKSQPAFASIKGMLRKPFVDWIGREEKNSLKEFVDIWYSEGTWKNLQSITIH